MTAAQSFRIYEITLEFIKDTDKAKEYVSKLEEVVDDRVDSKTTQFERIVTKDIDTLRQEMYKTFATKEDIARVELKISETKSDMLKWMVGMWIAQMAAILFMILKK